MQDRRPAPPDQDDAYWRGGLDEWRVAIDRRLADMPTAAELKILVDRLTEMEKARKDDTSALEGYKVAVIKVNLTSKYVLGGLAAIAYLFSQELSAWVHRVGHAIWTAMFDRN